MCGIAGSINFELNESIKETLIHRGPDAQTNFSYGNVVLKHWRLSIIDINAGSQPMHFEDRYVIVYNGEIYNHKTLRIKYNLKCHTHSDTETILHMYNLLGHNMLEEFDGMFVIAIFDKVKNTLFLARDRAGKKPLYVFNERDKLVFSSELNSLKSQVNLSLNDNNIREYFRLGFMYGQNTPYNNVLDFPAGNFAVINCNNPNVNIQKWWSIDDFYLKKSFDSFETATIKVDEYLREGIRRRIDASDLEVGCFLSGGIDSGLITAIASEFNSNIQTFTVAFDGIYDESNLAKMVAKKYQTQHTEIRIGFDNIEKDVEDIISNYGEPFSDSSSIPSYYVSKEAKKNLTVILNGDGGDELFGGYRRYVPFAKYDFFKQNLLLSYICKGLKLTLPISNNKKSKYNYIYRLLDLASQKGIETYLSSTVDIFEGHNELLINYNESISSIRRGTISTIENNLLTGLDKMLLLDFNTILFGDLLVKIDIATMSNSLEGRSPFLCKELLEYVPTINDKYKVNGSKTKYILRELSKKYLPNELINQPKRGFEVPIKKWVDGILHDVIRDRLFSNDNYYSQFCHEEKIKLLLNKKLPNISAEKRAKIIWSVFCLEVWYQKIVRNV